MDGVRDDYFDKTVRSATTFLARWQGSYVRVREMTLSHRTLRILLFADVHTFTRQNLLISADPLWMCGPFDWDGAAFRVEEVSADASPAAAFTRDPRLFRLHDPVGFELFTASLSLFENVKLWPPPGS